MAGHVAVVTSQGDQFDGRFAVTVAVAVAGATVGASTAVATVGTAQTAAITTVLRG